MMRHSNGDHGGGGGEPATLEVRNIPQMVSPGEFSRHFMGLQGCEHAALRLQGNVPIGTVVFANQHMANVARQQYSGWTGWGPKGLILEDVHRGPLPPAARPTGFSSGPPDQGGGYDDRHHGAGTKRGSPHGGGGAVGPPPGFGKQPRYAYDDGPRHAPANLARGPQLPPQQQQHQQQGRADPPRQQAHGGYMPPQPFGGGDGPEPRGIGGGGNGRQHNVGQVVAGGMPPGGVGMDSSHHHHHHQQQYGMHPPGQQNQRAGDVGYAPPDNLRMEGLPLGAPHSDGRGDGWDAGGPGGFGGGIPHHGGGDPRGGGGPLLPMQQHHHHADIGFGGGGGGGMPPGPPIISNTGYGPSGHVDYQPGPGGGGGMMHQQGPQHVVVVGGGGRMGPPVGSVSGGMPPPGGPGMSGMIAQLSDANFAASINAVTSQGPPGPQGVSPDPYVPEMRPPPVQQQEPPASARQPYSFENRDTKRGTCTTLYVDGLPLDITKRELAHIFRPFEGFSTCRIIRKEKSGLTLGFVEYNNSHQANDALTTLQGYPMDIESESTSLLRISHAKTKPQKHSREVTPERPGTRGGSFRQPPPGRSPAHRGGDPRAGPPPGRGPQLSRGRGGNWPPQERRPSPPRGLPGGLRRPMR